MGQWPYTSKSGKKASVDRLISHTTVAKGKGKGSKAGAANWGKYGKANKLGDYLYNKNKVNEDIGTWKGPYLESYSFKDPWGNAYVVNSRYFPNGKYTGNKVHKVMVLSAGPNGKWETAFSDGTTETISGDDIGYVVTVQ